MKGWLDIKADEKGVTGELYVPFNLPKPKVKAELTGSVTTDYTSKKATWGAGIKIRF